MQDRTVQDPTMEERRKAARNRSLLQGKILINDRRSVIDCVIHNLSQHGACLRVASLIGIPPAFELQIGDETSTRQCVAIWHSDARIGVEFRSQQPGRLEPERRRVVDGARDRPHGRPCPVLRGSHVPSFSIRPSAATARDVADLTVPRLIPMARAVSSSDMSR